MNAVFGIVDLIQSENAKINASINGQLYDVCRPALRKK